MGLILLGAFIGFISATVSLMTGGSMLTAVLLYSGTGACSVLAMAVAIWISGQLHIRSGALEQVRG